MTHANPRYQGKHFVRLLECYVLWAIDQLSEADSLRLRAITPKLQSVYGMEGEWQDVLAGVMEFLPEMSLEIRKMWDTNSAIARERNESLSAQQFAEMFVDRNLMPQ